ncbi:MAG: hypothetical protein RQ826_15630 [Xanthomonadales bacterium]|nr:hypothetical protein [Xanthomonadales bacterium]
MNRKELSHLLRAAARIADDPEILVLGSQAVLGTYDDQCLPGAVTMSVEADFAFRTDPDEVKADKVDGDIGAPGAVITRVRTMILRCAKNA